MAEHFIDILNCSRDMQDEFLDGDYSNYEATFKHLYMMPRLCEQDNIIDAEDEGGAEVEG